MTILVDCDNVMLDLNTAWITELNRIYNTNYKSSDVVNWDFSYLFPVKSMQDLLETLYNNSNIWTIIKPVQGAAKYLKLLQEEGHKIYIVTATDYRNLVMKIDYAIHKYFPFIPVENIITCYNKQLLNGDVLIDDNINNLYNGSYQKLLFTCSHNKDLVIDSDIIRVHNWAEIYNILNN